MINKNKVKMSDHEKEISKLLMRISELEATKEKQSVKIAKLKDEIEQTSCEANKTRSSSDNVVHSLSQELRALKQDLEKYKERERQVIIIMPRDVSIPFRVHIKNIYVLSLLIFEM